MSERARIARFFAPLAAHEPGAFTLTDDAAALAVPAGQQLVITTDSVIEGTHVLHGADARLMAQKLMRRNLSDLAAMGASPWRYTLNVHTPHGTPDRWFGALAHELAQLQAQYRLYLVGGDSTSGTGPAHLTATMMGLAPTQQLLRRNGATIGDDIYVSGTLGDAAVALPLLQQGGPVPPALAHRYHYPQPRLALGAALHGIASAVIDISDGLLRDLSSLCATSGVGAMLHLDALPLSVMLREMLQQNIPVIDMALNGGDDYELLFTAPASTRANITALSQQLDLPLTRLGAITERRDIVVNDSHGNAIQPTNTGWEHR